MNKPKTTKRSNKASEVQVAEKPAVENQATTEAAAVASPAPIENANESGGTAIDEVIDKTAPTTAIPAFEPEKATQAKPATATATGARYSVLAGRPSKQGVVAVFAKSGYAVSWIARAERLAITPEELCERFKTDPEGVMSQWEAATAKKA
jgi:hypothetical protein